MLSGCKNKQKDKDSGSSRISTDNTFIEPSADSTIHLAALNGNLPGVLKFLSNGTSADLKDSEGRTALMYSSFNGHTEIVRELLKKGSDINLCDNFGRSALIFASSGSSAETVKVLLDNYADPNIADKEEHFTALMYAASEGQLEIVKLLLAYKADPLLKDIDGDNALTFARKNGHSDVANLLNSLSK
jgi:ankyrin repeat protein